MTKPATGPHTGRIVLRRTGGYNILEPALTPLEILNGAFVFLCCCLALERAKIFSFARSRIFLA
jgi:hypothetical protein